MRKLAIALILTSAAAIGYLLLTEKAPTAPEPADLTLRSTTAGDVVGFIDTSGARAWLGIPFAEAPNGRLRWRAPQPPVPWSGVLEALAVGRSCPQMKSSVAGEPGTPDSAIVGDEDCLYLNVWSPADATRLPVMLWIHGGGNTVGTGATYNGANIAVTENVVFITINYRLGPFGWFSHPALDRGDPLDDSGNYGTLDVLAALDWTRDNVAAFGGDPGNVTVLGESAGAYDTLAMIATPLARGLFHRAIVQSGGYGATPLESVRSPLPDGGHRWSGPEILSHLLVADGTAPDLDAARTFQSEMGATGVREYLYGKTAEEIFSIFEGGAFGMIGTPAIFADGHVIPKETNEEVFGTAGNHNMVPVILGTNRDEPSLFMAQRPEYRDTFLWVFPRLKNEDAYLRAVRYGALAWKERGVDSLARYMTAAGNPNVYAYRFDWDEEGSAMGYDMTKALGAAHAFEIPFVFGDFESGVAVLGPIFENSPGKEALSRSMMRYWGQFAHTGDPGTGSDGKQVPWTPWGVKGDRSIVLDTLEDAGIRMTSEEVTMAGIKAQLESDPGITDAKERCSLYVQAFSSNGFDELEYRNFGPDGCGAYDPAEFPGGF